MKKRGVCLSHLFLTVSQFGHVRIADVGRRCGGGERNKCTRHPTNFNWLPTGGHLRSDRPGLDEVHLHRPGGGDHSAQPARVTNLISQLGYESK
ncbi:hypothetical protein F5Y07DRAFT_349755 [Xylaria sp. FL0933]|nr:hypothetical protein F5Y07DRAFT_349755 [Xylaria sp. FL0933]